MEIRPEISEKGSEISYMRLENGKDLATPDDNGLTNKQVVLKHLLQTHHNEGPDHNDENSNGYFNYESDQGFLKELFQIIEKHESEPGKMEEKKQLSDETCQYIHEFCMKHREASKFNVYSDYEDSKIPPEAKCKCGCGRAEGDPLPLCTDELQHYFFGPTILIFFYLRKMMILLVVIAIIFGIFSVITNTLESGELGNQCAKPGTFFFLCPFKMEVTTLNKLNNPVYMQAQLWLGFVMCIVWMLGTRMIRSMGRIMNKKIDSQLDSSSDYVIQINNLPYGGYTENELIKYMTTLWKKLKGTKASLPGIKSVQIVYQMDEVRKMISAIIGNARKLGTHLAKRDIEGKTIYEIKQGCLQGYLNCKMDLIRSMMTIEDYRESFINNEEFRKSLSTDIAFIEYSNSADQAEILNEIKQFRITFLGEIKEYIVSKWSNDDDEGDTYIFKGNQIRITRAPEPSDVNWSNCQKKNSYKRIALVWLIAFATVGISFGFLALIRFLRSQVQFFSNVSIISLISLQAFNRIIWNTLIQVVSLEQNNTKTDNIISIMSKGAFAQAINVLVNPLIFNYVIRVNILGAQGIIASSIDYHLTFLIMQTFLTLINVPYQMTRISIHIPFIRNWVIRKNSNVVGVVDTADQIKQILAYYEAPSFSIASAYTSTNTIIFHTMFYLHVQPFLIFSLIFNLCYVYFMHKYLLLRRYKIPELVDFIIFENCLSYVQHVPLIYGVGCFTWIYIVEPEQINFKVNYIPPTLCLVLWFVCVLNPFSVMNRITKKLIGIFGYSESELISKQTDLSDANVVDKENDQESSENKVFQRRESYYSGCGTNELLEYESKLTEVVKSEEYENLNKIFCERFNLKPNENGIDISQKLASKKTSKKMLPRMKQSFAIVRESKRLGIFLSGDNNRIIPIDVYKESLPIDMIQEEPVKIPKKKKVGKMNNKQNKLNNTSDLPNRKQKKKDKVSATLSSNEKRYNQKD